MLRRSYINTCDLRMKKSHKYVFCIQVFGYPKSSNLSGFAQKVGRHKIQWFIVPILYSAITWRKKNLCEQAPASHSQLAARVWLPPPAASAVPAGCLPPAQPRLRRSGALRPPGSRGAGCGLRDCGGTVAGLMRLVPNQHLRVCTKSCITWQHYSYYSVTIR